MAKIIITLEDKPDGGIDLAVSLDPPPEDGKPLTVAQQTGMAFVKAATSLRDEHQ